MGSATEARERIPLSLLCVDLDPVPSPRPWLVVTAVTAQNLAGVQSAHDAVALGEGALAALEPPHDIPPNWMGCVRGRHGEAVARWIRRGLTRIVKPGMVVACLRRTPAEPPPTSCPSPGAHPVSELHRVLDLAQGPAMSRDVRSWSRITGRDVRSLERLLRRHGFPSPKRFLSEMAAAEILRRREGGATWMQLAIDFDFHDDSNLLRFLKATRAMGAFTDEVACRDLPASVSPPDSVEAESGG